MLPACLEHAEKRAVCAALRSLGLRGLVGLWPLPYCYGTGDEGNWVAYDLSCASPNKDLVDLQ